MQEYPKLIMVFGLPGSGKTYFVKHFNKQQQAIHLSTDIVRKKMDKQGRYDEKTKNAVYDRMLDEMTNHLLRCSDVILDGTFYKKSIRRKFLEKAAEMNTDVYMIEIRADEKTIHHRLKKDRPYSEADQAAFERVKREFEPASEPHLVLWSDRSSVQSMINRAKKFIHDQKAST